MIITQNKSAESGAPLRSVHIQILGQGSRGSVLFVGWSSQQLNASQFYFIEPGWRLSSGRRRCTASRYNKLLVYRNHTRSGLRDGRQLRSSRDIGSVRQVLSQLGLVARIEGLDSPFEGIVRWVLDRMAVPKELDHFRRFLRKRVARWVVQLRGAFGFEGGLPVVALFIS